MLCKRKKFTTWDRNNEYNSISWIDEDLLPCSFSIIVFGFSKLTYAKMMLLSLFLDLIPFLNKILNQITKGNPQFVSKS